MAKKAKSPHSNKRSRKETPKRAIAPLVSQIELKNIRVIESHTQLSIKNKEIPVQFHTNVIAKVGANTDEKLIIVDVAGLVLTDTDAKEIENPEQSNKSSVTIQVVVQCVFGLIDEQQEFPTLTEDDAKAIQTTGVFAAYPYIRNFVLSSSSAMGIPPILMPLFRLNFQPDKE